MFLSKNHFTTARNDYLDQQKMLRFITGFIYFSIIILSIILGIKYILKPLSPFITAFIIVSICKKLINYLFGLGLSKKWAVIIFFSVILGIISLLLFWIIKSLAAEIINLYNNLSKDGDGSLFIALEQKLTSFTERYPTIKKALSFLSGIFPIRDASTNLTSFLPKIITNLMSFLKFFPSAVIFIGITVLSLFYIGIDYDKICHFLSLQLSEKAKSRFTEVKNVIIDTANDLFRAYFLLAFITFIQLLVGFLILDIDYAFILAVTTSLVDLFPILGTGTVLIPWAIISFLDGNIKLGIGLTVLYVSITIFRQLAEPKIVGSHIGLSPLLSLIAIYCGMKLTGLYGIFIFPITFITIKNLNESGTIHLYKNVPESISDKAFSIKDKLRQLKKQDKGK